MKKVPINDLKKNLAKWTITASKGIPIEITKHNRPFIRITPAQSTNLHIGSTLDTTLKSVLNNATRGKFLKILLEDRNE